MKIKKKTLMNNNSIPRKIFLLCAYLVLSCMCIVSIYPIIYVFSAAISDPTEVVRGNVTLLPIGLTFDSFKHALHMSTIWQGYWNSLIIALGGVIFNMLLTTLGAFALCKPTLIGRRFFTLFAIMTMWFNVGVIPFYLNYCELGLYNTRFGIIIAFGCTAYYFIILKSFFETLPPALAESATIDGANDWVVLTRIYLPLAKPAMIIVAFYYLIDRWNGYFWTMLLIRDAEKLPLAVVIKKLIVDLEVTSATAAEVGGALYQQETVIYAAIVIAIIPLMVLYPFIYRYFKTGITLGAVKE